jgi:hypothetical protein
MRQRRPVVSLAAACLVATLMVADTSTSGQGSSEKAGRSETSARAGLPMKVPGKTDNCRPRMNPTESLRLGGYRTPDGKLHFKVVYEKNVQKIQKQAFQEAMAMWNRQSDVTRIVLEDGAPGDSDFELRRGAPASRRQVEALTCASYEPDGSYIWYSESAMDWVGPDPSTVHAAARIYAHEIGHALNVDHKEGLTVMREGNTQKYCEHLGSVILADVQPADADDVRDCAHPMHLSERPRP